MPPAAPLQLNELRRQGRLLLTSADLRALGLARDPRTLRKRMAEMGCVKTGRSYCVTLERVEAWFSMNYQPNPSERAHQMLAK